MSGYLMFHLFGPLQSWGGIAVGGVRGTEGHPTKSAVLGLAAAALGLRRENDEAHLQLHRGYYFAVRVDHPGTLLRDYHTVQVPGSRKNAKWFTRADELAEPKLNTVLSQRDYRADALYSVALWPSGQADVNPAALQKAFLEPAFQLYLGRKSCVPAFPIRPRCVEAASLKAAFADFPIPEELAACGYRAGNRLFWESEQTDLQADHQRSYRDALASRSRWTFYERVVNEGRAEPLSLSHQP